jgi:signal transduction histidine kinase
MSLRVRLVFVIVALVTVVAAALAFLHLDSLVNSLTKSAFERSRNTGQLVQIFVIDRINQHTKEYEAPADFDGMVSVWNQIVTSDTDIAVMLQKMLALSPGIVEINVAGKTGEILASSSPDRIGHPLDQPEMFSSWQDRPLYRRMLDLFVLVRRPEYQVALPLGVSEQQIFTIQVVASSVLLGSVLRPELQWVALVSGGALVLSLVLTAIAGNWLLLPLKRIEQTIERILKGESGRAEHQDGLVKEFAAVESKLNVLGEQFRGARQEASKMQHNLDQMLERMESRLDIASRLTAISRITGGVAHEIKNPLNAISLHLDLLRARLGGPEEEVSAEIDILSKEVRRLDRVVKTFLDFSRPVDVKLEEVDLEALAREVADLMTPQARLANIAMEFVGEPAEAEPLSTVMRGDPDMLKQAILNLVTNALDAMADAKTADGILRIGVTREDESVVLQVADNGPGIANDLRGKVFQLYFSTKPKGSGIGLAMTFRAVQLHNGTIDFTSEDGGGTTFRLQFPALVTHA